MADPPPYRTPRWVKVFGIIVIGLVVLGVVALLVATALGLHTPGGPGGHMPSGGAGSATPPASERENADVGRLARTVEVTSLDTMTFEPSRINVAQAPTEGQQP